MAGRKPHHDRTMKVRKQGCHPRTGCPLTSKLVTIRQLANDDRAGARQQSGLTQLRDHPVEPVRALTHLIQKKDISLRRRERERRAERRQQLRQRAAKQDAGGFAVADGFERWRNQFPHRLAAAQGTRERIDVVALGAARQPPVQHRSVKGDQITAERQECENGGEIAVADERLAGALRLVTIEKRQDLRAAEAAANADQTRNRWIAPGSSNGGGAKLGRTGDVPLAREHRVVEDRLESQPANLLDPEVELVAIEGAGRRDDGKAIARFEGPRLPHHRKRAISSATARCSSRPRVDRRARTAGGRAATAVARNRSFARCWRFNASSTRHRGRRSSSTAWTSASSAAACVS